MRKPAIKKILQIGIVVKDLEKSVEIYEKIYGIGPWEKLDNADPSSVRDMKVYGEKINYTVKVALCNIGDVQIELLQPTDEISDYSRHLKEQGEGIHHIAVEENATEFNKILGARKIPEITSGIIKGFGQYRYFDTRNDLGFIMETYDSDKC